MKKIVRNSFSKVATCLLICFCFQFVFSEGNALAQGTRDTINIDFGNATRLSPVTSWNNVTDSQEGAIPILLNSKGGVTGIGVAVTDAFNTGSNTAGAAADDTLNLPLNAATDSFFGSKRPAVGGGETTGGVTLSNLSLQTAYSFAIFASRPATDNRETQYTVTGRTTQVVSLNPSGAKSSFVRVMNMQPADNGTITITATTGSNNDNPDGYYYLGAIKVTYTSSPLSLSKDNFIAYQVYPNPTTGRINIATQDGSAIQKVSLFTIDGRKVMEKEFKQSDSENFDASALAHGIYLVRVQTAKNNYVSRLVLQ